MHFYVQPLGERAECTLVELIFQNGLSDCRCSVELPGAEEINDTYCVTPEVLFRFVRSDPGQACNVYVKNDDDGYRLFPAYQLSLRPTLPSSEELAAMRCRAAPEVIFE